MDGPVAPPPAQAAPTTASPMMAQYLAIKAEHADCLLFYRMGDFYEMFFDDAVRAAKALDIALTKRGQHDGQDIPMCGVPVVNHEIYLTRLIRKGLRVAIAEQMEDPATAKKRGSKSVVARAVVRIITPGTLTEEALLDARANNYVAALAEVGGTLAAAWLDVSTGSLCVEAVPLAHLDALLARIEPAELVLPERLARRADVTEALQDWSDRLYPVPDSRFDSENARKRLEALYGVATLDAYGALERAEVAAAGALVDYALLTQKGVAGRIAPPRRWLPAATMEIDAATRRNLELTRSQAGTRAGSLLATIDRTLTSAGARLLQERLAAPSTDPAIIAPRLDRIEALLEAADDRRQVRAALKSLPDLERALARLALGRGGPRDLAAIAAGCAQARSAAAMLAPVARSCTALLETMRAMPDLSVLVERLEAALGPELPVLAREGGFIRAGLSARLDELRGLRDDSRRHIAALQAKYAEQSGVPTLRIRHNNVIGYHIEVSAAQADRMMTGDNLARFVHRQTLGGAVRFSTQELAGLERQVAEAADKALALELELFGQLVREVTQRAEAVAATAAAVAEIDVATALAELAADGGWVRPTLVDEPVLDIVQGRHPAVAAQLGGQFVANDCRMGADDRLWLLTGPNMAGKSTFLRQQALIAILAQAGAYVPAERATVGIVDRLFSRVGAADDLARGRSTFMVEMVETAAILNQAGPKALVILDEIGRGTATFDGLSIAWAAVEYLHAHNRSRALFATHYHELTALDAKLPALSCHHLRVKEWQGSVVFLHAVAPGAADRSYGVHVARLAGLPPPVIARAEAVLALLERGEQSGALARLADDLPLFRTAPAPRSEVAPPAALAELAALDPDALTPREALEALYRLKGLL